ncbi:MAG: hypothetical protein Q9171_005128 [Xanthocarpia ochracea]
MTANRWFVPAEEYLAATEDYAVVGESAYFVKNHLIDDPTYFDILDGALAEDPEARLIDVLDDPLFHGDIYGTGEGERLVYADVDRDSEEHRQLWKAAAKAGLLEEESAEIKEAKEKLFEHLSAQCHCCSDESSDEDEPSESKNEERAASIKETHERTGHVSSKMIDYVLKLESEQACRNVLTILSRQDRRKSQRPVMLLVGMIDKFSEGVKEGWLIGYDFYANNIIIKPYHADDRTQHPLGEKWDVDLPDDGVSWKGHPAVFAVDKLFELQTEIENNQNIEHQTDIKDESYSFKLLAYVSVGFWILKHWDAVASIKQADGTTPLKDEERRRIRAVGKAINAEAEKLPSPFSKQHQREASASSIPTMQYMQTMLEDCEMNVRRDALRAKDAGKENIAQNAAKLYEQLLGQLQSFNLDPERSL